MPDLSHTRHQVGSCTRRTSTCASADRIGAAHPGDFTGKVVFRGCPDCGEATSYRATTSAAHCVAATCAAAHRASRALLHRLNPYVGLTESDLALIRSWCGYVQ